MGDFFLDYRTGTKSEEVDLVNKLGVALFCLLDCLLYLVPKDYALGGTNKDIELDTDRYRSSSSEKPNPEILV